MRLDRTLCDIGFVGIEDTKHSLSVWRCGLDYYALDISVNSASWDEFCDTWLLRQDLVRHTMRSMIALWQLA